MDSYQNILVALDLYSDYKPVLERALNIAQSPSQISLVYVTFPQVYFESYGVGVGTDYVNDNQESAKATLSELAKTHHIPDAQVYVPIGSAVNEIHVLSESIKADLIVMGTHGQSGLKLLLGSTANGVLHGVKCDVLAIRI
ncbi:universal stress protein [Paraglaciecola sp. MB-3u-78]|uniref:universal stress protein n=1 Tax=Paraglaciecola sp. MB-3u-78 TaxID=2058332 RepID=UPI000C334F5B|nr:universal stress protein [Paraglaciecola sp. MB-3u-78]PKG99211.1 universal stress protein [Paraglaciecola sp. MB-3u-78]